ncbi:unnamed protein product [Owenia fusiformis]|uniref:Fanconi-associated nuclease n=1 Tax=Owenia fusiformis TaxID=6347 RepID=A0A8J1XJ38_OWEFU|nr:unnamed protein product [Owenia fusiformis]
MSKHKKKDVPKSKSILGMFAAQRQRHINDGYIEPPEEKIKWEKLSKCTTNNDIEKACIDDDTDRENKSLTPGNKKRKSSETAESKNEKPQKKIKETEPLKNNDNSHVEKEEASDNVETSKPQVTFYNEVTSNDEPSEKEFEAETVNENINESNEDPRVKYKNPYYWENFKTIINTVLENEEDSNLFNADEKETVADFYRLSDGAQKLYIRLFQRKYKWITVDKINYDEIGDCRGYLNELVQSGFLIGNDKLDDVESVLKLLSSPDLKSLAKSLHITTTNKQKHQLLNAILSHCKKPSISAMFGASKSGTSGMVFKRAKSYIEDCYKLVSNTREVFTCFLMLFNLSDTAFDDDDPNGGQQQLFQMLMSQMGKIVYPKYKIQRDAIIFKYREQFLKFTIALTQHYEMLQAMGNNDFDTAKEIYEDTRVVYQAYSNDQALLDSDKALPIYLRCFTATSIYTRLMTQGVELLQKLRQYEMAVQQLEVLLSQEVYCLRYRGRWYDRLALNLEQHLKQPQKSLDVIKSGLDDVYVRTGRRLALFQRAERICNSPSHKKLKCHLLEIHHDDVIDAPKETISGRLLPHSAPGSKTVFIRPNTGADSNCDEVTLCSVEDLSIEHYKDQGYDQGLHGEGSTFCTLFGLLNWDIIFKDDLPDVFRNPYQTSPLDFHSDCFYAQRKSEFDTQIKTIKEASIEQLQEMITKCWEAHQGELCAGVNWELFNDLPHILGLVKCIGGPKLAGICERLARDYRNSCSGVPDLVVWSTTDDIFKVVEVKGPGDRLSTKQILWLDYLLKLKVDACVCHVSAVAAKKLTR